jgi:hypothetical protein
MAKAGFRVMDSDIHVMEPHDLWQRYIEPGFRDRAPRLAPIDGSDYEGWQFDGKVFPAFVDRPDRRRLARERKDKAPARHLAAGRYCDPAEDLPGHDPPAMLQAMDREGIESPSSSGRSPRTSSPWTASTRSCRRPSAAPSTGGCRTSATRIARG